MDQQTKIRARSVAIGRSIPDEPLDVDGNAKFRAKAIGIVRVLAVTLEAASVDGSGVLHPSGSDTEVQYNDVGQFAGDPTFTFNKTSKLVTANHFKSDAETGSPYACESTELNENLNADLLDGEDASAFADAAHEHAGGDITSAVDNATNATNADTVDSKHVGTSGNKIPLLDASNVWAGTQDMGSAALELPNTYGSSELGVTGQVSLDTADRMLLISDGATRVYATPIRSFTFTLDVPLAAEVFEMLCVDRVITITSVTAYIVDGTNYIFNIEKRAPTTPGTTGNDIMTADITAVPTGATKGSADFTTHASAIPLGSHLVMVGQNSMSGVPTKLIVRVNYTEDVPVTV
jgi:hypothetical protein